VFLKNCILTLVISVYFSQLVAMEETIPSLKNLTAHLIATYLDSFEKDTDGLPNFGTYPSQLSALILERIPLTSINVQSTIELAQKLQIDLPRHVIDKIADVIVRKLFTDNVFSETMIEEIRLLHPYQEGRISFKIAAKLIHAKSWLRLQERLRIGFSLILIEQKRERINAIVADLSKKIVDYIGNSACTLANQLLPQEEATLYTINEANRINNLLKDACCSISSTPSDQEALGELLHKNIAQSVESNLSLQQSKELFLLLKTHEQTLNFEQICFIYIVDALITFLINSPELTPIDHIKFHILLNELKEIKDQHLATLFSNTTLTAARMFIDSILQEYGSKVGILQKIDLYVRL
jgi:hypothetical protein